MQTEPVSETLAYLNQWTRLSARKNYTMTFINYTFLILVLLKLFAGKPFCFRCLDVSPDKQNVKDKLNVIESTRWFKYDRDCLCVNKMWSVLVIFEPHFIYITLNKGENSWTQWGVDIKACLELGFTVAFLFCQPQFINLFGLFPSNPKFAGCFTNVVDKAMSAQLKYFMIVLRRY